MLDNKNRLGNGLFPVWVYVMIEKINDGKKSETVGLKTGMI